MKASNRFLATWCRPFSRRTCIQRRCDLSRGRHSRVIGKGVALAFFFAALAGADPLSIVPPRGPGPYAVGCSNIEQDFSRLATGETADLYWEGVPSGDRRRYVTDLLLEPANSPVLQITVPGDAELFGSFSNQTLSQVLLICYPTSPANSSPDYPLPDGTVVPRMQRGSAPPVFASADVRYPVLLFSHGLAASPLSGEYVRALLLLASEGYVVVAPFHADARVVNIRLEDLNDVLIAILNFPRYTAMQAIRPLALKAAADYLLSTAPWSQHVDPARLVGFGASLGGESLLLQAGARLTTTVGLASKQVMHDARLKAAVGYVPYFGQDFAPAFGRDQNGVEPVTMPYLAIAGTADTTAPLSATERGMRRLTRSRELVVLEGTGHYFDDAATGDIFTWTFAFLAGHAGGGDAARAQIQRMREVAGGGGDRVRIDYTEPSAPRVAERTTIEFHNDQLDQYFVTADPSEIAMLDEGRVVPGWRRTAYTFKTWSPESRQGRPMCRLLSTPSLASAAHVLPLDPIDCGFAITHHVPTSTSVAFRALPAGVGTCPADRMVVTRLYNNGKGGLGNHRYLTSGSEIAQMLTEGWIEDGPVFCTPP